MKDEDRKRKLHKYFGYGVLIVIFVILAYVLVIALIDYGNRQPEYLLKIEIDGVIVDVRYFTTNVIDSRTQIVMEDGRTYVCRGYLELVIGEYCSFTLYKENEYYGAWEFVPKETTP